MVRRPLRVQSLAYLLTGAYVSFADGGELLFVSNAFVYRLVVVGVGRLVRELVIAAYLDLLGGGFAAVGRLQRVALRLAQGAHLAEGHAVAQLEVLAQLDFIFAGGEKVFLRDDILIPW